MDGSMQMHIWLDSSGMEMFELCTGQDLFEVCIQTSRAKQPALQSLQIESVLLDDFHFISLTPGKWPKLENICLPKRAFTLLGI